MEEVVSIFTEYLKSNIYTEIITLILGIFSVILFFLLKKHRDDFKNWYLYEGIKFFYIFSSFLAFLFLEMKLKSYITGPLFKNIFMFFIFYQIIDLIFEVFKINRKKLKNFIDFLLGLNIVILFFLDLMHNFSLPYGKNYNLIIFLKIIVAIPFLITFFYLSMRASIKLPLENKTLKNLINKIFYITNIFLAIFTILWITGIFKITFTIILGFVGISLLTILFLITLFWANDYINKNLKVILEVFPDFKNRVDTVLAIIYFISSYFYILEVFNVKYIHQKLKSLYIVKTDVLSISVYSLIEAIIFYLFILNLIILLKVFIRYLQFKKKGEFEPSPIEAVIYNFGILLASIIALSMLGITWKVLLPIIGALGIGAGFGLQSIINNYISGFIMIFNRKVEIGDVVEIKGNAGDFVGNPQELIFGIVTDIGVINTVIKTVDGISVAIPNSRFVSDNIINYTLENNYVRMRIPFKIPYDAPNKKVEEILLSSVEDFKNFLSKYNKPQVWFFEMKDYYNEYVLVIWIDARNWKRIIWLKSEIYKKAWEKFEEEGIEIPVTTIEIIKSYLEKHKNSDKT
ncbi:mechanosensitive ion channel family protein [Hydrogenothermus marinus]|uniref:Mechanosensitive ion channel-like protein n=1 Tax=Hydrogenothermus marinus TaxID=133270 RepID=A0A3M0BIC4_9AQUI|nr:mechanosensitive ion channel domain-containing protein [Hydrogenothermus marinus]RMA97183.1 mechanosensitive ion channel-like protein [Hydrogenothermus marinus]